MIEYRVKEVKVPMKGGDFVAYYPQIKLSDEITTGHLWWKKTVKNEKWHGFYKDKSDGYIWFTPYRSAELVCCDTKEDAEKEIRADIKNTKDRWLKSNKLAGIDYEKQEHVNYYPFQEK